MSTYKRLASDTAIYGLSSIIGRVLNWCLTPYYTRIFAPEPFGVITNLYAYAGILTVMLTYGMETSFFRYASKSQNSEKVYSTALFTILISSLIFVAVLAFFKGYFAEIAQYPEHPEYILWFAIILAIDAITAIPFAKLRLNNRPVKFAFIKIIFIVFNIGFNLFFLTLCPYLLKNNPESWIRVIYSKEIGIGYVFISNLLATILTLIMLLPEIIKVKIEFDKTIFKNLISYGFPILIVGIAGMITMGIDKILIPFLVPEDQNPAYQLGIYGANFKIAVLMNMFIQAFRYAFEPFFFSRGNTKDDPKMYATIMKYFVIFGLLIFLGMMLYIDIVKLINGSEYIEGIKVLPLILMANLFFGIYFGQSLWYKLTDKTIYGAYQGLIGAAVAIILNVILIPIIGYMGSAVALFVSFFVIMVISYVVGQKYYPVPYDLKRIGLYFMIAIIFYIISFFISGFNPWIKYTINTALLISFLTIVFMLENREISILFKFNKKK